MFVGLIVIIGGWWYFTNGKEISKQWSRLLPGGKQKEEVLKLQPSDNQTPIDKLVLADGIGVTYRINVKLAEPWKEQVVDDIQLLRGGVILLGDPLRRVIQVQIGMLDGTAYVGEYRDGWGGKGFYRVLPQNKLEEMVDLGDEMRLEYRLPVESGGANTALMLSATKVLDGLASEYRSGEYTMTIPTEFMINTEKVGVLIK